MPDFTDNYGDVVDVHVDLGPALPFMFFNGLTKVVEIKLPPGVSLVDLVGDYELKLILTDRYGG